MTRYLNPRHGELPPAPSTTDLKSNPRVTAILYFLVAGMAAFALIGLFVSHVL